MHIPKGKPVHEKLKTSYVNTAALLADLQINGFTGYLQIIFQYCQSHIFLKEGKILNAFDESGDRVRRGDEAVDAILLRVTSPDGLISVYSHTGTVIEAISGRIDGEILYQGLESDFTDLKRLVEKLAQQNDGRFYLEIKISTKADAVIYIIDGNIDGVLSLASGEIVEGEDGCERIFAITTQEASIFHVYRCRKPISTGDNVIAFPEPTNIEAPLPAPAMVAAAVAVVEPEPEADPIEVSEDDEIEKASVHTEWNVSPVQVEEVDEEIYKEHFEKLLSLMGEVVAVVERSSGLVAKEGNFSVALRSGLLEVTETYPFFDPFAKEFEYQNGRIRFTAAAAPIDLVNGLAQALRYALREMARSVPAARLRPVVAEELLKLLNSKQGEFKRFGLLSLISEIVTIE